MRWRSDSSLFRGGGSVLRDSRIGTAVAVGILMGAILAYVSPHSWLSKTSEPTGGSAYSGYNTETAQFGNHLEREIQSLESRIKALQEENSGMRIKEASLEIKLRTSEQERDAAKMQVLTASGVKVKAGPVGTVRSLRTNPSVTPNEAANPALAKILSKIAINREVLVGISNNNVRDMLKLWFENIKRAKITNYLVVALDDPIAEFCREHKVPVYRRDAAINDVQASTGDNHAVSGLKFQLLRDFLVLGYSVLLSDVDIVYLQNPFQHLHRDCDVESMSDGFDNITAYGYNDVTDDPSMGWARYAHTFHIWMFNSGLFYIRPTLPSIELLDRVTTRVTKEKAWDQAVFNEELFFPSRPGYEGLHASKRVLDYLLFLNSKVLFKTIRKDERYASHKPVTVHVNYHPDKYERMLAIIDYYVHGKKAALDPFPDGTV
ncbi:hypothetical protein O6H91_16G083200 [Diphasiastrum complanatum]|uniref:Uncharacterized protein n=4 Tax=Diphasiastrum complanatum TaxID=34168 RepID=A0ACC2BE32_DIPCM|nr:hypothetical protein O6H91_16G082200 [Diphasiastrum complanatum]KAJ7528068.1 hypothetical protein O6H91_16G082200 [Diphasiastrum complanatum]KAJ7528088.1 hypothetical protein O6H91_16G083200 [Diphasiastrum complanatum]